jgi:FkbM family methyltransferase
VQRSAVNIPGFPSAAAAAPAEMLSLVHRATRRLGFEIRRYAPASSDRARLAALLMTRRIDLVLDVGANAGQYAAELRELGYRGRVVSFEPLRAAHAALARAAAGDPLWTVAPRTALGVHAGEVEMRVSENLVSSSVLNIMRVTVDAAPAARVVAAETAPVARLDAVGAPFLEGAARPLLKLDVQGYEAAVLEGASGILDRFEGVQLELSLTALYEGQPLAWQLNATLERHGFEAHALLAGFSDAETGRMLQVDGVYFRRR